MRQGAALVLLITATSVLPIRSWAEDAAEVPRKVLVKTTPTVSTLAVSMHLQGVVKLEVVVAPNGTVKSIAVKGGHPLLVQSAEAAVGRWKFEPAPHETKEMVEIKFESQ